MGFRPRNHCCVTDLPQIPFSAKLNLSLTDVSGNIPVGNPLGSQPCWKRRPPTMPRYPEDVLVEQWAPGVTRAAVIRDPSITSGTGQFGAIQAVAPALGVELTPIDARDANEIEHTIAGSATGGVIVTASPSAFRGRDLIIALAARHRLPAVYPTPRWAADGGLISYGPDEIDQHRRAVCYAGGRYATAGASLSSH